MKKYIRRVALIILGCAISTTAHTQTQTQAQTPAQDLKPKIELTAALTEAHTIIGMQYFVVGTLAKICETTLNKPATYTKEMQNQWLGQNKKFIDALTRYQGALFADIDAKLGKEKLDEEKARFRQIIIAQGSNMVDQFMSRGEKPAQCAKAEHGFSIGYFDITPKFPLFAEAMALVQATAP
jgi:hypothetical protein